jgi:glycerol-3-phosphate O-acyltransferase
MKPEVLGPICEVFGTEASRMIENIRESRVITKDTLYQQSNTYNRAVIEGILDTLFLPGSELVGLENLVRLNEYSRNGESCLILMEHYSNFDIPSLVCLLSKAGREEVAEAIVAIAGMKLNEDSPFVHAFSEAYTRIVIYPSRSLDSLEDPKELEIERKRSQEINMAATRQMIRLKHGGKMVLVFPSGTRYRPGRPDTKRGVKEVDSYIKSFDWMVFVGIAGNVLQIHPTGDMSKDLTTRDVMILQASEPVSCQDFRDTTRDSNPQDVDPKQHVADVVMSRLEEIHGSAETLRQERLAAL